MAHFFCLVLCYVHLDVMNVLEVGWGGMDWIELAEDRDSVGLLSMR